MRLSKRARVVGPMELATLMRLAASTEVIDIALGVPPAGPPMNIAKAAQAALAGGSHQYAEATGLLDLRRATTEYVKAHGGILVDPETEVTITCGATEGVFISLLAVTDPGDEVLIPEPYYELYPGMTALIGAVPIAVPLVQPGWRLDISALRKAVSKRTRAVLLNTPHNPTGRVFDRSEIEDVVELCNEYSLACITDEVYEHYVYDDNRHLSPFCIPSGRHCTVSVGSLSKTLQVSGWRIGYCLANAKITDTLRRIHERTTLGTSHPLQRGAVTFPDNFLTSPSCNKLQDQRDQMVDRLRALGFEVCLPQGGWFSFARIPKHNWPAEGLARQLIRYARVLIAPGTPFFRKRADGAAWMRTTFIRDPDTMNEALDRIGNFLRDEQLHG